MAASNTQGCSPVHPRLQPPALTVAASSTYGCSLPHLRLQVGLLLSLLKLLLHLPFLALLLPLAAVAGALSTSDCLSDTAVGIAWDSAGVTTGEATPPADECRTCIAHAHAHAHA